jgi:hypothetical protein
LRTIICAMLGPSRGKPSGAWQDLEWCVMQTTCAILFYPLRDCTF